MRLGMIGHTTSFENMRKGTSMIHAMRPIRGREEWTFVTLSSAHKPDHGALFEIIQEGGDTFQGRFALPFNLYFEVDFGLADAA